MNKTTKAVKENSEKSLEVENQELKTELMQMKLEEVLNNPRLFNQELLINIQSLHQDNQQLSLEITKIKEGLNQLIDFLNSKESELENPEKEEEAESQDAEAI